MKGRIPPPRPASRYIRDPNAPWRLIEVVPLPQVGSTKPSFWQQRIAAIAAQLEKIKRP